MTEPVATPCVETRSVGPVRRITLNDPARGNALSTAMLSALEDALVAAAADPGARVVILSANGRIFCSGHDLGEIRASEAPEVHTALFELCARLMLTIADLELPVIAEVQGAAVAAGCQLVAACDLALADPGARFAAPGINLGLFCSTPGVEIGRSVGRKAAAELLLTGAMIPAARAAEIGLINRVAAAGALAAETEALAAVIAEKPREAVTLGKRTFARQMAAPHAEAYAIASAAMVENLAFPSARSGIDRFLDRGRA